MDDPIAESSGPAVDDPVEETSQPKSYRERVLSSLAWQGSAQFIGQAFSWVSTFVVINLLDTVAYGLMSMATVFVAFVLMMSDLGIGAAIVQAEKLDRDDLKAIQAFVLAFNVFGFFLTLAASPGIAWFFEEPALVPILLALSGNFLLLGTYIVPQSRLMRDLRFDQKAKVDLTGLVLSAGVALTMAWQGFGVWSLVGGTITTHVVRAIGFNVLVTDRIRPVWDLERGSRFLRFGSVIVVDRFLWFAYSKLDIVLAGKLLGASMTGLYSVSLSLAAMPLDKVMPVLTQIAFPAVAQIQDDPERVKQNMLKALRYGNLIFLPVFWGLALVAPDALDLLLDETWGGSVVLFQMICIILPLKALAALFPPALFGTGRPEVNVVNMAISLVLLAIGFFVGSQWGIVGLAGSWLVVYPIVFVVTTTRAIPVLGIGWWELLREWRGVWFAALVMSAAVWGFQSVTVDWHMAVRLVVSIAVGAGAYVGVVLAVERTAVAELRALLAR